MKRIGTLLGFLLLVQPAFAQTAVEKAEKRLADLLAPGRVVAAEAEGKPVAWAPGRVVSEIVVPVRPYAGAPVRLTQDPVRPPNPRAVPEGTPLRAFRDATEQPGKVELPTKPLIRLPSLDMHTPLALPILAQPARDRASLGDPALDASVAAALKPFTPTRDRPTPFVPYNLPDPFENVRYGQLPNPPAESAVPPVIPLQRPTK